MTDGQVGLADIISMHAMVTNQILLFNFETVAKLASVYVSGSSKIQTLCHLTQVLLKLRFRAMERLSGY